MNDLPFFLREQISKSMTQCKSLVQNKRTILIEKSTSMTISLFQFPDKCLHNPEEFEVSEAGMKVVVWGLWSDYICRV